mgnify:CR=1 FL=1
MTRRRVTIIFVNISGFSIETKKKKYTCLITLEFSLADHFIKNTSYLRLLTNDNHFGCK